VVVRAPSHYAPTMAALAGGKHVYTEWPLGITTAEAQDMANLAREKGVQTAIGLQSRVNPAMLYMKELIATGYVGKVLTCRATAIRVGHLERPAHRIWFADEKQGATPLTIMTSHIVDSLRFVTSDFTQLSALVTSQVRQWRERETGKLIDVTAPDNIMLHGHLANGAVAAVQVATVPFGPAGYVMEVYGTEGKLAISSKVSSNHGEQDEMLKLRGVQKSNDLQELPVPDRFFFLPPEFPRGTPFPIGQMYALLAQAISAGNAPPQLPTFDTALQMHRLLDVIRQASHSQKMVTVPIL
jgi:predicted dehydrogenase